MTESTHPKDEPSSLDTREIRYPRELRALTHPVRLALLEVLAVEGALTATQAGESSANRRPRARSTSDSWPSTALSRRPVAARVAIAPGEGCTSG